MTAQSERWEQGSEYSWVGRDPLGVTNEFEATPAKILLASGRDAIRALLEHGRERRGWKRVWMPTYLCQEVVGAACSTGIPIALYYDNPDADHRWPAGQECLEGDVLFSVNYFGLRDKIVYDEIDRRKIEIVEDHTHDPWSHWSQSSEADYCLVSLRKTLPIPDGAMIWSPRNHTLPEVPRVTGERELASAKKFAGMLLKALYLDGWPVGKDLYRRFLQESESHIASGAVSSMTYHSIDLLKSFPLAKWRRQRAMNYKYLRARLNGRGWLRALEPASQGCVPFSFVAVVDRCERRNHIRQSLIAGSIYPAVLWPLETCVVSGIPQSDVDLSRRILSIHSDMRYRERDMDRVAEALVQAGEGWRPQ